MSGTWAEKIEEAGCWSSSGFLYVVSPYHLSLCCCQTTWISYVVTEGSQSQYPKGNQQKFHVILL